MKSSAQYTVRIPGRGEFSLSSFIVQSGLEGPARSIIRRNDVCVPHNVLIAGTVPARRTHGNTPTVVCSPAVRNPATRLPTQTSTAFGQRLDNSTFSLWLSLTLLSLPSPSSSHENARSSTPSPSSSKRDRCVQIRVARCVLLGWLLGRASFAVDTIDVS